MGYVVAAAAVVSAATAVKGGIDAKKARNIEAAQYEDEQESARVAALQDEVQKREQLRRAIGTQQAIRSGRGLDFNSGSGKALRKETTRQAERDILTAQANYLGQQRKFGLGAASSRTAGNAALVSGVGRGVGTLLSFDWKKNLKLNEVN